MLCYVSPAHSFFLRHKQLQTKWYIKNGTIFKFNSCTHLLSRVNFEKMKQGFLLNDYLMTNRNLRKATKTAKKILFHNLCTLLFEVSRAFDKVCSVHPSHTDYEWLVARAQRISNVQSTGISGIFFSKVKLQGFLRTIFTQ